MIWITSAHEPALTTITVDGQLAGDAIQQVEASCEQARSRGKPISLYLRDVIVLGEDGKALLRRLATDGVTLKASGLYNTYVVQTIQPRRIRMPGPRPEPVSTFVRHLSRQLTKKHTGATRSRTGVAARAVREEWEER